MKCISMSVNGRKAILSQQIFATGKDSITFEFRLEEQTIVLTFIQKHVKKHEPELKFQGIIKDEICFSLINCNKMSFISDHIPFPININEQKLGSFRIGAVSMGPNLDVSSVWLYTLILYEEE